jgi:hypothetical protein
MNRALPDHVHALPVLLVLGTVAVSGCGQIATLLDTKVFPPPSPPARAKELPQAYARSQINDPKLEQLAREFKTWALAQRTDGARPGPLFSRIEVLPPTRTVLPYGVGAYEQELRLPVILTVGPGWASQNPGAKEILAAQAFRKLSQDLEALKLDPPLRPTLTIQTPNGLELAWMNDFKEGRSDIHGEDVQARPSPSLPSSPPPILPAPVDRGKKIDGGK